MKEPHNYRKVGYSMIVISVSLVAIGLIVWAIGDNYHYSSDLMSGQEIDTMTPKNGYNIILFDDSQPVGAKLKLLDHAGTNETALQLKEQHASLASTIMIFDSSVDDNKKLVEDEKLIAAQIAQGKTNQATQNTPPTTTVTSVVNASVTATNHGNESATIYTKLNATNGTSKYVNLNESIIVTLK